MEEATALPKRNLLLIKPPFPVPTAWAYKKYAELKESGKPLTQPEKQFLGNLEIVNDLEAPVFHKYLLLPVMKTWLREKPAVEAAFMTGSGSTMVAVLAPEVTTEQISIIKKGIQTEFGETMWLCETGWAIGDGK